MTNIVFELPVETSIESQALDNISLSSKIFEVKEVKKIKGNFLIQEKTKQMPFQSLMYFRDTSQKEGEKNANAKLIKSKAQMRTEKNLNKPLKKQMVSCEI